MRKKAFFVNRPRRLDDLKRLHLVSEEEPFEIVRNVALRAIDYTNFSEDLLADRAFLDDWNDKPTVGGRKQCIFVHRCNKPEGILVVPTKDSHVLCAAYWSGNAIKGEKTEKRQWRLLTTRRLIRKFLRLPLVELRHISYDICR